MSKSVAGKDYLNRDPAYGLNDWDPVVAYVRGLMENSEDKGCWPRAKARVMANNLLLSQSLIQYFGQRKDARGVEIICEKLAQIGADDMAIESPWCTQGQHLELVCLKALAEIGGDKARAIIEKYRSDPGKSYLADGLAKLKIADAPRLCAAPYPDDFPEILKRVRSINDVKAGGGCEALYNEQEVKEILKAWRGLKWPGPIEYISGDGETTTFEMKHKFVDHVNDFADPFSDCGIYLANPKMEYPIGRRRWAISHTFLFFPVIDASLYDHEYTWDIENNTITTHLREHVELEEVTANADGKSVTVNNTPISTAIETRGNVFTKKCNSAVRGVWDNPQKQGKNYYVKRANIMTSLKKLFYFEPLHRPVVNQFGIWVVDESERPERFFDSDGNCIDIGAVAEELLIPLHEPKVLAWSLEEYKPAGSDDSYSKRLPKKMWPDLTPVPQASVLDPVLGVNFIHSHCGLAGFEQDNDNGYKNGWDINSDGIIDERDKEILTRHAGEVYRMNVGDYGYFGFNWLSLGNWVRSQKVYSLEENEARKAILVCSYDYGAGYDADSGKVDLFESVEPGKKMYVEYHHDIAAAAGKDNVKVYLHEPI